MQKYKSTIVKIRIQITIQYLQVENKFTLDVHNRLQYSYYVFYNLYFICAIFRQITILFSIITLFYIQKMPITLNVGF